MTDVELLLLRSNTWNHLTVFEQKFYSKRYHNKSIWNLLNVCKGLTRSNLKGYQNVCRPNIYF